MSFFESKKQKTLASEGSFESKGPPGKIFAHYNFRNG